MDNKEAEEHRARRTHGASGWQRNDLTERDATTCNRDKHTFTGVEGDPVATCIKAMETFARITEGVMKTYNKR